MTISKTVQDRLNNIDVTKPFQFLYVQDCGPSDPGHGSGTCPHCGAEGRYIYVWAEYGITRGAMAGCYKMLTGHLAKSDYDKFFETLSRKLASNKPLSGFQKTVVRMQQFIQEGKYSKDWCEDKIKQAVKDHYRCAANFGRK